MKYLNREVLEILEKQQNDIVMAQEDLIMVEACPGAGKTYTIVKRVCNEFSHNDEETGIIACSFTNESSDELKKRLKKKIDIVNSFVGTLDSFILSEINGRFINRYLDWREFEHEQIVINKIVFPSDSSRVNNLTCNPGLKQEVDRYFDEWFEKILHGVYEISFPSYVLASEIVKSPYFTHLYALKYSTIYIDEAQDLNYYQHKFIEELHTHTNIKVVMVGDSNQSIYHFRGANPSIFRDLVNNGYKKYVINVSVRCHPSITYYANKIVNYNNSLANNFVNFEKRIEYISEIDAKFLNQLSDGVFILCESNKLCKEIYDKIKDDFEIYYVKPIDITNDSYVNNRDLLEKVIKFYFNFNNPIPKNIYSLGEFYSFVLDFNSRVKERDLIVQKSDTVVDYIHQISKILDIIIDEDVINEIDLLLKQDVYRYYYYVAQTNNRIMTIHSSKGLENANVIVCLENKYKFDEKYRNKLFVAITRAIDKVYLYPTKEFASIDKLLQIIPR